MQIQSVVILHSKFLKHLGPKKNNPFNHNLEKENIN